MKRDPRWELFRCQRCGRCCREIGLPYDCETVAGIAEIRNIPMSEVIERYYGKVAQYGKPWLLQDGKGKPCPFLRKDGEIFSCEIYSIRPNGCKLYPFATVFGREEVDCPAARIADDELGKRSAFPDAQRDARKGR